MSRIGTIQSLRQINTENGRTVYINVQDMRSFYNFENKLIIEMQDGTTYTVLGAPNVNAFYTSAFSIPPTEISVMNSPLLIEERPTPVAFNSATVNVSNVSVTLLAANPNRKLLFVQNESGSNEPVYINFKTPATLGNGIALVSGDPLFTFPTGYIYTGIVTAISGTTSLKSITASEGF